MTHYGAIKGRKANFIGEPKAKSDGTPSISALYNGYKKSSIPLTNSLDKERIAARLTTTQTLKRLNVPKEEWASLLEALELNDEVFDPRLLPGIHRLERAARRKKKLS